MDAIDRLCRFNQVYAERMGLLSGTDPRPGLARADVAARLGHPAAADALVETAELLLDQLSLAPEAVTLRDLAPGDTGWLTEQHGRLYARDEGFDHTFEALVAEILADFLRHRDPGVDRGWIAAQGSARLGSIFCVRQDETTAKLRLFFLRPEARGLGLGRKMLDHCMAHARAQGFSRMALWTHESHRAACALYRKAGWHLLRSEPKQSFGQAVVEQHWQTDL